jgi:hypothetical protein
MASPITRSLAVVAALFGGLLAGVTANRALVQLPAFERIGVIAWANLIRAENHGIGSFCYPVVGLMALLLTVATAIVFRYDRSARGSLGFPIYSAVVPAIAAAVVTRAVLVPAMFSLRAAGDNAVELQRIFLINSRWWGVNDFLHILAFALNLWALTEISSSRNVIDTSSTLRKSESQSVV